MGVYENSSLPEWSRMSISTRGLASLKYSSKSIPYFSTSYTDYGFQRTFVVFSFKIVKPNTLVMFCCFFGLHVYPVWVSVCLFMCAFLWVCASGVNREIYIPCLLPKNINLDLIMAIGIDIEQLWIWLDLFVHIFNFLLAKVQNSFEVDCEHVVISIKNQNRILYIGSLILGFLKYIYLLFIVWWCNVFCQDLCQLGTNKLIMHCLLRSRWCDKFRDQPGGESYCAFRILCGKS